MRNLTAVGPFCWPRLEWGLRLLRGYCCIRKLAPRRGLDGVLVPGQNGAFVRRSFPRARGWLDLFFCDVTA